MRLTWLDFNRIKWILNSRCEIYPQSVDLGIKCSAQTGARDAAAHGTPFSHNLSESLVMVAAHAASSDSHSSWLAECVLAIWRPSMLFGTNSHPHLALFSAMTVQYRLASTWNSSEEGAPFYFTSLQREKKSKFSATSLKASMNLTE